MDWQCPNNSTWVKVLHMDANSSNTRISEQTKRKMECWNKNENNNENEDVNSSAILKGMLRFWE